MATVEIRCSVFSEYSLILTVTLRKAMWVTEAVTVEAQMEEATSLEAVTAAMREGASQRST